MKCLISSTWRLMHVFGRTSSGKVLEVRFVERVGQVLGVVEHHHAAAGDELAEQDAGRLGPGALGGVGRRIVAQQQHVELVEADRFGLGVVGLQILEELFERLVASCRWSCGRGRGSSRRRRT